MVWCVCVWVCVYVHIRVHAREEKKHWLHALRHWLLQRELFYVFRFSSLALNGNISRKMPRRVVEQGLNYRDLCTTHTLIICLAEWFSSNPARFPKKAHIWDDVMSLHPIQPSLYTHRHTLTVSSREPQFHLWDLQLPSAWWQICVLLFKWYYKVPCC